ncbi:MAG: hypothetical protein M3Y77_07775 [Actinomycetota bacterium]|nr:hypothetical protein [Actinomycetota bacterium]
MCDPGWLVVVVGRHFPGAIADDIRTSSVYADASYGLDIAAAERAIGNRRLAVVFLNTSDGGVASHTCKDLDKAADGVLLVIMYRDGTDLNAYGCSLLPGAGNDANFGNSYVAESEIGSGTDGFAARPLDAVKILVTQYDSLARADIVPHDARVIHPSAPRYLLAFIALAAVIGGAALIYFVARRAGRAVSDAEDSEIGTRDAHIALNARMAGIAALILRLDNRYALLRKKFGDATAAGAPADDSRFMSDYRSVAVEYTKVAALVGAEKGDVPSELADRVGSLADRVDALGVG